MKDNSLSLYYVDSNGNLTSNHKLIVTGIRGTIGLDAILLFSLQIP
jgi:hypothetical protein